MTPESVRAEIVGALQADLIGPFDATSGEEVLPLPPSRWYLTGFLAPQGGNEPDPEDGAEDELEAGNVTQVEDAGTSEPEPARRQYFPSSMGLSVFLPPKGPEAEAIIVSIQYADYEPETVASDTEEISQTGWRRLSREVAAIECPLDPDQPTFEIPVPDSRGITLHGEVQATQLDGFPEGARVLSLFVVNNRPALQRNRDQNFIFQVGMKLSYERGFLPRPNRQGESSSESDHRVLALQFRNHFEWAVGHNTSVENPVPAPGGAVRELQTTQLPSYEVRQIKATTIENVVLGMKQLSELRGEGLARALSPMGEAYRAWIAKQKYVPLERETLEQTRDSLLERADNAVSRIEEGIQLLREDEEVRTAFSLANLCMHASALQADRGRADKRYSTTQQPEWRTFQLAFVLTNLASVADPSHKDREVADLIYFPTGGGKTEAYLGLIAFTLILRRLRGKKRPDEGRGVAVILRYTLRLLTLDQLGRAATLMCALEEVRNRQPEKLGNARFAVGLWVGRSATANRLKDVHTVLNDFTPGMKESPFPLSSCPWCGEDIGTPNIRLVDDEGKPSKTRYTRAVVYCDRADCLFTERRRPGAGLPVLFVDDQIYQEVPDFIVATVDKFAMMPWRAEAGMLFGRAAHIDSRRVYGVMDKPSKEAELLPEGLYPPELIVQDELHLISGPLGTMVGLYETAIDYLSEREIGGQRRVPKVVCSTATIRRAREQIKALFEREISIFPARGIDDGDNFFSVIDREKPGRLYLGVAAPGRALRAVSVRTYATTLAAAQKHYDSKGSLDQAADPYMTLVGYFNSLRELGGMRRLVEDEVASRVRDFTSQKRPHHFVGPHPWGGDRGLLMPAELTSRETTARVKDTKDRLAVRRASPTGTKAVGPEPLDTVLASNMISVGLDVDRLGLMVVTGQPKTTSEYIQATSRVGRAYPGLVVVCLNSSRPRDRSHYERFVAYHQSFYREVEATSVTPFSIQTLDRGMVATLLSMLRHGVSDLQAPLGFMEISNQREVAEQLLEAFVDRGRKHREFYDEEAEKRIENQLRKRGLALLDAWERIAQRAVTGAGSRIYSRFDRAKDAGTSVMYMANDDPPNDYDEKRFMAPTSMRDVEPETHLWVRFAPLDRSTS